MSGKRPNSKKSVSAAHFLGCKNSEKNFDACLKLIPKSKKIKDLEGIRAWILINKDEDSEINKVKLDEKISEYQLNTTEITTRLQKERIIKYDNALPGRWRVIEAKKKKMWTCPKQTKFAEADEAILCTVTGAIISNPNQCTPDCDLLQEES